MASILDIATSGLISLQRAIATSGHNIANVNTEGYSRQRVEFQSRAPDTFGGGFLGSGVETSAVKRSYDGFLVQQIQIYSTSLGGFQAFSTLSARLDSILVDPQAGLNQNIEQFFNAMQDVANNPASIPERYALLGEADALAAQIDHLDTVLQGFNQEVNSRLEDLSKAINSLAENIATVNSEIVRATNSSGGKDANDLLDKRDTLLAQLSTKVGISTFETNDGSVNVTIGNGQPLVVGSRVEALQTISNAFDASRFELGFSGFGRNSAVNISSFITGGEIQGVLDFRDKVLNPARNQLGLLATGLTATVNAQHRLGTNLDGNQGGNFFTPIGIAVAPRVSNTGAAMVTATLSDSVNLKDSDYLLRYDGSQWFLTRQSDDYTISGSGPFNLDGITIDITGAATVGDRFLIRPTHQASSEFNLALSSPTSIAAALPLRALTSSVNVGTGTINALGVSSSSGLPLAASITLTFDVNALGPGIPGFNVSGGPAGPIAYDPVVDSDGKSINMAGFGDLSFTLKGVPQSGDTFTIESNQGGKGDNRNALLMVNLKSKKLFLGGTTDYLGVFSRLVSDVGVKTRQAKISLETDTILLSQAEGARQSISGVNLDEEAANLLRFQQAYQASAQLIAVADTIFQTLLQATRR